jgi:hypothetical protein
MVFSICGAVVIRDARDCTNAGRPPPPRNHRPALVVMVPATTLSNPLSLLGETALFTNCAEQVFSEVCLRDGKHGVTVVGRRITLRLVRHARRVPMDAGGATKQALRAGRLRSPRRSGG